MTGAAGPVGPDRFSAYGASHLAVLSILLLGAVVLVWFGRAHRETATGRRFDRFLAIAILALTVPLQAYYLTPGQWDPERSLPLQLCDLAWLSAAYALWTHRWWAVALTFYWGLTLTTQAVVTPDLTAEFPDPVFLLFWGLHLLVVWAAIYLSWGLGLTPDWRSYRFTVGATTVWAVTAFCINLVADTNFGYLNSKPGSGSLLDLLGDWPWYVLAEIAIVVTVWALITWPLNAWSRHTDRGRRARFTTAR